MTVPAPNPRVLARRLDEEVVLVNLDSNEIYALNETGARFWELLTEGRDRAEIEVTLSNEFDVGHAELTTEIDQLLTELDRLGLIVHA